MKNILPTVGWSLLGLLVVAGGLLSVGQRQVVAEPQADSYAPSGTAALFSLLKSRGYSTSIDRSPQPKLETGDLAIAFTMNSEDEAVQEKTKQACDALLFDAKKGATVFWLPLETNFQEASTNAAEPQFFGRRDGEERKVSQSSDQGEGDVDAHDVPILSKANQRFVWASRSGLGRTVNYADGIGLTNRFIDKGQNAQVFLELLQIFAKPHARIVFTEATFGNAQDPGLLETIGTWAEAAWYQLLFLFVVIIYSLNRRFGLPEQYRPKQRGTRELLDAVTDTYSRARATGAALEAASADANYVLRSVLKVPRDASVGEMYRLLPESLINAMTRVRAASEMPKTPPKEAHALIVALEMELDTFLQVHRPQRARRRKAA